MTASSPSSRAGAGRRMGAPKALAPLGGGPLIARPLAAAAAAGLDAVVVAKPDTPLPPLDVPVWHEPAAPQHPLLGIVTALERSAARSSRPAATSRGCRRRCWPGSPPAPAPRRPTWTAGRPLPARYPPGALGALRAALAAEAPLRRTLAALAPAQAALTDAAVLAGINTPEELAAAEKIVSRAS